MTAGREARSLAELTRSSDLVFRGRVVEIGESAVRAVKARSDLAVVELEEGLRVDPVLGDLTGKPITVELAADDVLDVGDEAIFFTRNWLHGENLAVREVAHVPATGAAGDEILTAVEALPDQRVQSRVDTAERIVLASVSSIAPVEGQSGRRQSPRWARARLAVDEALKGPSAEHVDVYFPTGDDKRWRDCPRLTRRQRAVFLLRSGDPLAGEWLESAGLPDDVLTALDPADVQPARSRDQLVAMVSA